MFQLSQILSFNNAWGTKINHTLKTEIFLKLKRIHFLYELVLHTKNENVCLRRRKIFICESCSIKPDRK